MAIIKCKMCGGDLELTDGATVATCEYCGTTQTVPSADNEKKLTLFARAERLRRANEFDKAAGVYESIVADFPDEAEAYWGLVLCRYGIEYVDDPATGKKVPTCHRSSFDSILEDSDFEQACENTDAVARRVYREEARAIEEIRKGILEVSGREAPYDIFICYKETDENGGRTLDSVIAQDVYDALTEKGYRVFFSRISLEDKLGTEYEPYIFAALNSAKVMLVFGTDFEYMNAVWVKNEWSRFLRLIASGQKKTLIPCYKGLDAYDMPKEFAKLQAQDMGKVGAVQDLIRGIGKIIPRETEKAAARQSGGNPTVESLLKRGQLLLEDGDWKQADEYFNKVLELDPECAEGYLGKAMAELTCSTVEALSDAALRQDIFSSTHIKRAEQFAKETLSRQLSEMRARREAYLEEEKRRFEENREKIAARRKKIAPAASFLSADLSIIIARRANGTVLETSSLKHEIYDVSGWRDIVAVCIGFNYVAGLREDGTVALVGDSFFCKCDVSDWRDIVAISNCSHLVGLKADGTVVATGHNEEGQCDVSDWRDIVAVDVSSGYTIGLKKDGTVVVAGDSPGAWIHYSGVEYWKDIVAISAADKHFVGLKADGTVEMSGPLKHYKGSVKDWRDIIAVSNSGEHLVGLRADGTVVATGNRFGTMCDVEDWRDIVAVYALGGSTGTVGLRADGTVVTTEKEGRGEFDMSGWRDIAALFFSPYYAFGLKEDGSIVVAGSKGHENDAVLGIVSGWKLFDSLDTIEQEREEGRKRSEQERKEAAERAEQEHQTAIARLQSEKIALQNELANLHGLFSGKRRKEIEARLAEIEKELNKLK